VSAGFSHQTRLALSPDHASVLDAYAVLHGRAERCLFAALQAGRAINDIKRDFQPRFGITARQFNALSSGIKGKIAAVKERRPALIKESAARIRKAENVVAKLSKHAPGSFKLHQKKRRLSTVKARRSAMVAEEATGVVRLCFGSRRLFRAQFDLEANGYASHGAWRRDWESARSNQFFVLGSQDEMAGNQTCQAVVCDDALTLTLRLPDGLGGAIKHMTLHGVRFPYGHAALVDALNRSQRIHTTARAGTPIVKRVGSAVSYRFVRDAKGWRVFASVEVAQGMVTTHRAVGAIGVDINADHLALAETDRFGNVVRTQRIALVAYGKTRDQAKAMIGDACVGIAAQATAAGKPVVIEALDFQKKKAEVEDQDNPESGACSACPVRIGESLARACAALQPRIGLYLDTHGETPWRESSAALFG